MVHRLCPSSFTLAIVVLIRIKHWFLSCSKCNNVRVRSGNRQRAVTHWFRSPQVIVGITKSAPARIPVGQREVTTL